MRNRTEIVFNDDCIDCWLYTAENQYLHWQDKRSRRAGLRFRVDLVNDITRWFLQYASTFVRLDQWGKLKAPFRVIGWYLSGVRWETNTTRDRAWSEVHNAVVDEVFDKRNLTAEFFHKRQIVHWVSFCSHALCGFNNLIGWLILGVHLHPVSK